jgi:hypothetical protein
MPLTMRPTDLGAGIDKDRPDYTVYCGGWAIGRIYQTRGGPDHLRWFWSLTVDPPMARADRVATLEEAKAQFQKNWDAWKAWAKSEEIGWRKTTCGLSASRQTAIKIWVEYLAVGNHETGFSPWTSPARSNGSHRKVRLRLRRLTTNSSGKFGSDWPGCGCPPRSRAVTEGATGLQMQIDRRLTTPTRFQAPSSPE